MLPWNRPRWPVRGPICVATLRGKKIFVLLWKIPLSCGKGVRFGWKAVATEGEDELWWDVRSVPQPNWAAWQTLLKIVLHVAQCTSHAAAKYPSSAKNWLHCRAIKVKYYPLLPKPQANTAAGEGQQRKNDIMKPKRESKHHASSMRGSATAPGQRLASLWLWLLCSLCARRTFFGGWL